MAARAPSLLHRATDGPAFVRARYGSARGLIRLWLSGAAMAAGLYRRFGRIDWAGVRRLVFVCSGNICRSPHAERRAAAAGFAAISVALRGDSGNPADAGAMAASRALGIDLGAHASLAIGEAELRPGDLLVAMEPWQARLLAEACSGRDGVQITLLGLWSRPRRPHIHDPHRLGGDYFRTCFRIIDSGVAAIVARARGG